MFLLYSARYLLILTVLFFSSSIIGVIAQKTKGEAPAPVPSPVVNFGVVMRDQFAGAPTDSTAEAVVLYNYGEVYFNERDGDIWMHFTHHVRARIYKKLAYHRATI